MTDQQTFQVSQGLQVLRPRSGNAYPIPCEEWSLLKGKISEFTTEPWLFHTLGSLLLGAALSVLISILSGTYQLPAQQRAQDLAWAAFAVCGVCGVLCLIFAHKERGAHRERASDVVAQMDLIEKRYETGAS